MAGAQADFSFSGLGLFTGVECKVRVHTAAGIEPGLWVTRPGHRELRVRADVTNVTESPVLPNVPAGFPVRNTTIMLKDGSVVATVEHLLSALAAAGIWNALIEVEGPEIPILDGSSLSMAQLVAKHRDSALGAASIVIQAPIVLKDKGAQIEVRPRIKPGAAYSYTLDLMNKNALGQRILPEQHARWESAACGNELEHNWPVSTQQARDEAWEAYLRDVAPARTFSFDFEARAARQMGLFASFTPRDLPVIAPDGTLIENAWREPPAHEPARHKLLDLIGDLALVGGPIQGEIIAKGSGHSLNRQLCREILAQAAQHTSK